jgi:hypothetical protein
MWLSPKPVVEECEEASLSGKDNIDTWEGLQNGETLSWFQVSE